jgi:uncharacterized membrane protein YfcA
MKNYFKRTRHHLHAIVGITGGFIASLALSWVWLGFRNLNALDKAMWFLAPAFIIGLIWEWRQGKINKMDIVVSGISICLGVYLGGIVFNWLIN